MNVLINCLSSVSGGAVSYLGNVVPAMNRLFEESPEGNNLKILANESQKQLFASIPQSQCLWIRGRRPAGWRRLLWEHRNLHRIARDRQIDVLFHPGLICPLVPGVRQVLMLQNMEPFLFRNYRYSPGTWLRNYLLCRRSRHALRTADRVIAVSGFTKDHLLRQMGFAPDRVRLIYHGRDAEFSPEKDTEEDRKLLGRIAAEGNYLLTCGSLLPYRRCEDVIAAFDRCADSLPANTKLVIAGSGTDSRYAKLIRKMILNSPYRQRISAPGHVSKKTMIALYRNCLVCVIASEIEACPNIAIEAMSSGCAVVSCDRPPLPEMFQGCSLEFRSRNVEDLVLKIRMCIENDALRRKLKASALKRARDFSWDRCARQTYSAMVEWQEAASQH